MSSSKAENSETPSPPVVTHTTLPAVIAFTLLVVVACFVGFSILYFYRGCFFSGIHTWIFQRSASAGTLVGRLSRNASSPPNYRGLDPSLLQTFPTFLYASVKNLRKEKNYSLECAICLLEFEDDSLLRLLTFCCHVFHQECIDLWLRSRKTCPVCRMDLDSPDKGEEVAVEEDDQNNVQEERRGGDDVCIEVKEGEGDHGGEIQRHDGDGGGDDGSLFARSHSTGHSVVMIRGGGEEDKYTLRLPEHVALKVVRGGRNCTKSCSNYKDMAMAARPPSAAPCSNCGYVQSHQSVFGCSSSSTAENT